MNQTESIESKPVKVSAFVPVDVRRSAKVAATMSGEKLQDWIASAIVEKLAREARESLKVIKE